MQSIYVGFLSLMFVITTMAVPDFVQTLTEGDKNVVLLVTPWIKTSKTGVLRLGLDDNFFKTSSVINGKCRLKHAWASTCLKVERRSVALCFVTCSWSSNLKLIGCSSQYKKLEIYSMIFETADTLNEQRKIYIKKAFTNRTKSMECAHDSQTSIPIRPPVFKNFRHFLQRLQGSHLWKSVLRKAAAYPRVEQLPGYSGNAIRDIPSGKKPIKTTTIILSFSNAFTARFGRLWR